MIRYLIVGVIWIGVLLLGIFSVVSAGNGNEGSVPIALAGFITAAISTGFILNDEHHKPDANTAKRKNEQGGGLDALSLLTPQDLEDLRQDIKDRLRERILSGEDGELSSLDSLLTDQRKRK
jgi:hypothetical protein